jgi:Ras-related protein Rab-5C
MTLLKLYVTSLGRRDERLISC